MHFGRAFAPKFDHSFTCRLPVEFPDHKLCKFLWCWACMASLPAFMVKFPSTRHPQVKSKAHSFVNGHKIFAGGPTCLCLPDIKSIIWMDTIPEGSFVVIGTPFYLQLAVWRRIGAFDCMNHCNPYVVVAILIVRPLSKYRLFQLWSPDILIMNLFCYYVCSFGIGEASMFSIVMQNNFSASW